MRFGLLALTFTLPATLAASASVQAATPQAQPTAVVGAKATAPAVEKIIGDLMARLIPQVLSSITQPEINIQRMNVRFGNKPGATRVQALTGTVRVGLTQAFEYALLGENDLRVDGVPGLNMEMMKDFIPVVKIGPAQTIVGVDFMTLSQPNSSTNVIQSNIGFLGSKGETALKIQVGSKKFEGVSVLLKSLSTKLTLNGDMVLVEGTCDVKQEVAKLGFAGGKVQVVDRRYQDALCGFQMNYSLTTKQYEIALDYSSQQPAAAVTAK